MKISLIIFWNILGTYSLATIKPVVFNTTENVVTSFTPLERGCYTEKEFQLNILKLEDGYRYSIRNCLYSSAIEKIIGKLFLHSKCVSN